jgi:hypothetical protein
VPHNDRSVSADHVDLVAREFMLSPDQISALLGSDAQPTLAAAHRAAASILDRDELALCAAVTCELR